MRPSQPVQVRGIQFCDLLSENNFHPASAQDQPKQEPLTAGPSYSRTLYSRTLYTRTLYTRILYTRIHYSKTLYTRTLLHQDPPTPGPSTP